MASLLAQSMLPSSLKPSKLAPFPRKCRAVLHQAPQSRQNTSFPLPKSLLFVENFKLKEQTTTAENGSAAEKLLAVMEAAGDRAEMHAIIGEQRNNWSHFFLHSINSITLSGTLMAGLSATPDLPLHLSSAVLFTAAAGLMLLVNKIQPSQLVEEQRNASRLFRQLERSIRTTLCFEQTIDEDDVDEAMDKVLALQMAYPLPLLPGMLEKFPEKVTPANWWPKQRKRGKTGSGGNGWTPEVERAMRGVARVLKEKDGEQYVRLGRLVLNINKSLALAGPVLAGVAAAGCVVSAMGGGQGAVPAAVGGALAAVVNTVEHGGQVGMVFELFRNCAGYYKRLEEEIEFNLGEEDENREKGDIFELKMALQLGRSLSEIRRFGSYAASSSSCGNEEIKEFAGKLF